MSDEYEARAEELRVVLYCSSYDSVHELLQAGDTPEHVRKELLHGMSDDETDEAAVTKRAAIEDALAGRPPRW